MNRQQAVDVIKEIFQNCEAMEGKSLKLLPPQEDNSFSHTFQIHVELRESLTVEHCVNDIAKKHNLAVKESGGWLIVYKSYMVTPKQKKLSES